MNQVDSSHRALLARIMNRCRFIFYGLYGRLFAAKSVGPTLGGQRIKITTGSSHEVFRAFTFLSKEPETIAWIDDFVASGPSAPVFYDIGANIGIYSLYAAAAIPAATILAFEPESQPFAALCRNIAVNGFDNIVPYQFALSNEVGIGLLHIATMVAGAARLLW